MENPRKGGAIDYTRFASASWRRNDFLETFQGGNVTSGQVGDYGWNLSVGTGSMAALAPSLGHAGCRRVTTGAVLSNTTVLYKGAGGSTNPLVVSADVRRISMKVALPDAAVLRTFMIGLTNTGNNSTATEQLSFLYDPASSLFWQPYSEVAAGVEQKVSTKLGVNAAWMLLEWLQIDAGLWVPSVNGVVQTTHSVRLPSVGHLMPSVYDITNTAITAVAYDIDEFFFSTVDRTTGWT